MDPSIHTYTISPNNPGVTDFYELEPEDLTEEVIRGGVTIEKRDAVTGKRPQGDASFAGIKFDIVNDSDMSYSVLKVFFANIKRGGILLIQMAVGSLYLFSVPRGYTDGFNQWCKQIIALCLTAFLQTTLLFLGLLTFNDNMLLGLGVMLAAGEVPRIAQQFGLDSSVKVNMMSVVHATSTAVNMTRSIARAL